MKKIFFGTLVLLLIGSFGYCLKCSQEEFMPHKQTIINLSSANHPLFLRATIWGVAGNHEEIVLSNSESGITNKREDYIFYTSEIFYKVGDDNSINIFAPEGLISEPLEAKPNVSIKGLKDADEIEDYRVNFQKYGLKQISVYPLK